MRKERNFKSGMMPKKVIVNALLWIWDEIDEVSIAGDGVGTSMSGSAKRGSVKIDEKGKLYDIILETQADERQKQNMTEEEEEEEEELEIIDAKGRLVIPGLHDGHIHVEMTGESSYFVNLADCTSIESLQEAIFNHSEKNPDLPWIIGVNWDQTNMDGRYPSRYDLDTSCPSRPVFLWRACWHIGCVNSVGTYIHMLIQTYAHT